MKSEYDPRGRKIIRGKYAKAYHKGHSIRILDGDKRVKEEYFVSIDADLHVYFADSKAVNRVLRAIVNSMPESIGKPPRRST